MVVTLGLSISSLANVPGHVRVVKMILFFSFSAHWMNRSRAKPDSKSGWLAKTTYWGKRKDCWKSLGRGRCLLSVRELSLIQWDHGRASRSEDGKDWRDSLRTVGRSCRTSIRLENEQIRSLDNWSYSTGQENRRRDRIVRYATVVPKDKQKDTREDQNMYLTRRRANSKTRPAVSTQIRTLPSRLIVSRIVAERKSWRWVSF